ncbi:MAG: hypothetical protein A2521_07065 [Deltaproteobacteria bacterium RIFOXYD12_FULL_57_12]|nr:MAG: hypothetical protein A2521_07065 [Deltaproteobacteria bacterium RIFOXYD12_FULL_57_12]
MNEPTKVVTDKKFFYFAGALFLGFVLTFVGLWKGWEIIVRNATPSRSTRAIALHYRINVLESRISDLESGAYYRRIASLTGGDAIAEAIAVHKTSDRLNGTLASKRKELDKARNDLAQLVGRDHASFDAFAEEGAPIRTRLVDMAWQDGK